VKAGPVKHDLLVQPGARKKNAVEMLLVHDRIWRQKASLRIIYKSYFKAISKKCQPGETLEIGAGSGIFRDCGYSAISTDIECTAKVDVVSDAQSLPFVDASFTNIVGVDVLHHIERPIRFLREVHRVLQPKGRLILLEPAITPISHFFFRKFHPEPFNMEADILDDGPVDSNRDPFLSNQAIPTLLVSRYKNQLHSTIPGLKLSEHQWLGSLAYPLSGGFQEWSLVPRLVVRPVLALESLIDVVLGRWTAFRLIVTLERS